MGQKTITTQLAGTAFDNRKAALRKIPAGVWLEVVPEPDNPNDPNAVCLYYNDQDIGFVPRDLAKQYRGRIQAALLHENEMITLLIEQDD